MAASSAWYLSGNTTRSVKYFTVDAEVLYDGVVVVAVVCDVLGLDVEIVLVVPAAPNVSDGLDPVRAAEPRARADDGSPGQNASRRISYVVVTYGNMYLT